MKARVHVSLKSGVLDPQGAAVAHALGTLGFEGVRSVRQGKVLDLDLDETDPEAARAQVDAMCRQLLANTVVETWRVEILG
ncbi:phosphoribosylformylglycinamidine synthase subunit PurS [Neomegalonema sp.]|uniref:phosphoribosylformylglycinamidine synthase subunit PurS n=1 Tax=Neomegalonema sp. TaxID=2039713 RepID=UPI0026092ED4|nr:phosphoribosylformylglycinamidine synthase subunit PurS [Neomegalonema sp.]MDD2867024.1 phosphoribosylformylglycinamidine synthase subunit PurS [Neomegalonema sp.]